MYKNKSGKIYFKIIIMAMTKQSMNCPYSCHNQQHCACQNVHVTSSKILAMAMATVTVIIHVTGNDAASVTVGTRANTARLQVSSHEITVDHDIMREKST